MVKNEFHWFQNNHHPEHNKLNAVRLNVCHCKHHQFLVIRSCEIWTFINYEMNVHNVHQFICKPYICYASSPGGACSEFSVLREWSGGCTRITFVHPPRILMCMWKCLYVCLWTEMIYQYNNLSFELWMHISAALIAAVPV